MSTSPPTVRAKVEARHGALATAERFVARSLQVFAILCSFIDIYFGSLILGNLGDSIKQYGFNPPSSAIANSLLVGDLFNLWPGDRLRFLIVSAVVLAGIVGFVVDGRVIAKLRLLFAGRAGSRSSAARPGAGAAPVEATPAEQEAQEQASAFEQLRGMEVERDNQHLYAYLKWKYGAESKFGEPIFERNGVTFPLAVYPAAPSQVRDPESALIRPVLNRFPPARSLIGDPTMRELIHKAHLRADNLETFTMRELTVDGSVSMSCQKGKYWDMIDTCDALEWEIMHAARSLRASSPKAFTQFDKRLRLRKSLHSHVSNPVRSGANRSVAVSLSCLIAFYQDERVYLMVRKRSTTVAVHLGLFHVIPSFMFQPATAALDKEYSLLHNIEREYLEELFDRPDPVEGEINPDYFIGDPRLQEIQELLRTGRASWYYTGIAVNLLSLRPEICTLLLIRDDTWYQRHRDAAPSDEQAFRPHFEFAYNFQKVDNDIPIVENIPLMATDEQIAQYIEISPETMVPCGAFAFWAGVDLLRSLPEVRARIRP